MPIKSDFHDYSKTLQAKLKEQGIRCEIDLSSEKLGYKIRQSQVQQVPYMIVIGQEEVESGVLAVRSRDTGETEKLTLKELTEVLDKEKHAVNLRSSND